MKIKCESCGKTFEATKPQVAAIEKAIKGRQSLLILTCGVCHMGFGFRPVAEKRVIGRTRAFTKMSRCVVRDSLLQLSKNQYK